MRPKIPDKEKRKILVRLLISEQERIQLSHFIKRGKFGCMSDFLRYKIFDQSNIKIITLDEKEFPQIKKMDYELNKIGVNFNQIAKRMNTHDVYQVTNADREVFKIISLDIKKCFSVLQNYFEMINQRRQG